MSLDVVLVVVLLGIFFSAGYVAWRLFRDINEAIQAKHWVKEPVTVDYSETKTSSTRLGPVFTVFVRFRSKGPDDVRFDAALPSRWGTSREHYACKIADHFHDGANVVAHFHPTDPKKAFLMVGVEKIDWVYAGFFALVSLMGLCGAIFV